MAHAFYKLQIRGGNKVVQTFPLCRGNHHVGSAVNDFGGHPNLGKILRPGCLDCHGLALAFHPLPANAAPPVFPCEGVELALVPRIGAARDCPQVRFVPGAVSGFVGKRGRKWGAQRAG